MALESILGELALDSTSQNISSDTTEVLLVLNSINGKIGYFDPTTGAMRVAVTSLPTLATVTTVSTVNNQSQMAGYSTAYDQYSTMAQMVAPLRSQIVVTA